MRSEYPVNLDLVIVCDSVKGLLIADSMAVENMLAIGLRLTAIGLVDGGIGPIAENVHNNGIRILKSPDELKTLHRPDLIVDLCGNDAAGKWLHALPQGSQWLSHKLARPWMTVFDLYFAKKDELQDQIEGMKEKANNYQYLFDNSVIGMYRTSIEDGSLIIGNRKLAEIFEYEDYQTFLTEHNAVENYVDPKMRDVFFSEMARFGKVNNFEVELKRRDGSSFWACMSGQLFPEKGYNEGMILDIDKRKQAEETNKFLSRRLLYIQEDERKKIARDLHDELGQALSSLQFSMGRLKGFMPEDCERLYNLCDKVVEDIENIGNLVRRISSNLRPDMLDHLGLIPALESHVESFKNRNPGTAIQFNARGFKKRLHADVEIVLYRVVQEALNNIEKHACATTVEILLTFSYPRVILNIKDDGVGFVKSSMVTKAMKTTGAIGLLGMRERLESIGGSLSIRSAPGKGTVIRAKTGAGLPTEMSST